VHIFRGRSYAFRAVLLADYAAAARPRSARWKTLSIPAKTFVELADDLAGFL